ncbi:hypothetical protein [Mycobacterium botniense]|uniref:Integral membrane protein n=1 Tax=Mycobacterium botniense TaxID=84962 RepID=A0A7I9XTM6_9MYCO|nr:hypothetical protein [Mycobacterium botniense]GFG72810.1 integral membrane protein [Mycobacterium botniense]
MTVAAQPGTRIVSTAAGLLMVVPAAAGARGPVLVGAALAVVAVVAGIVVRPAATLAVLLSLSVLTLADVSPVLAALSGLSATGYLAARHAVRTPADVVTVPTVIAAVGFTFVGVVATSFPLQLPWLPLAAPPTLFGIYALATRPYLR